MAEPTAPLAQTLAGKTAAVTGASSGIGRAVALALGGLGADLVIQARRNAAGLDETAAALRALGRDCHCLLGDLSEPAACGRLASDSWAWRPIDIWVQNAGADVLTGEAAQMPFAEKLDLLYQTDVRGGMLTCREVGKRMQQRGEGVILTVGWDQAETGMAGDSGEMFAAIKGAVMAFTRSLAKSLAPQVRVNCLAPGWIQTKWGETAPDYWQDRARLESLLERWGAPDDVAAAAAYLASPQAAFVTGQVLNINGGFAGSADS
ncbi:3-oxoacyl-[acyl-carrier-protein] reductase FabG [Posidoniimonas polymericola]|uniref:3-oxoacyl-[acyl-carrier-protein] reductase FabG n=1 Tax=Posidoniimonas polymericola TaxID=2528002 RepID=A0A5C5XXG5_9BACT|nr:SDR family oxidoreductase [Posidoniimonas polymericola]TWT66292.1 3-oxoacyl-[acyl-carrier-protein] reductase FabG [Posidoniimonas polymericola]